MKKQIKKVIELIEKIHAKTSNFTAQKLGPIVFNARGKESSWNLSTANLLQFPNDSLGKTVGKFLFENKMEPIAGAESHDVYHVLFNYSTSFKDEVGLQFFLRGNGVKSPASFLTSIGAWCILPFHWKYLKTSYRNGKNWKNVSQLNLQELLHHEYKLIINSLKIK